MQQNETGRTPAQRDGTDGATVMASATKQNGHPAQRNGMDGATATEWDGQLAQQNEMGQMVQQMVQQSWLVQQNGMDS